MLGNPRVGPREIEKAPMKFTLENYFAEFSAFMTLSVTSNFGFM